MRSSTPDQPAGARWDGPSPGDHRPQRALRLHPDTPTRLLRAAQLKPCADCSNILEWYYCDNGRPLPLHPRELPLEAVPEKYRWHVLEGVAHRGPDGTAWCRVPHRALCPAVQTPSNAPSDALTTLRRRLAVNTRRLQDTGRFTPPLKPLLTHEPSAETSPQHRPRRDVVQLFYSLYLAPGAAAATVCVAQTLRRTRCPNPLTYRARDLGHWTVLPVPPGRRRGWQGELTDHLTDTPMAVYDLSALPYPAQLRWRAQHCIFHADSQAADTAVTAWEVFDPFHHHQHITPAPPGEDPVAGAELC